LLFRRQRRFALGRYLANENVARLHDRTDTDDAAFVEVAEERFADVRNIARDFFRTELGIARFDFIFLDVNRGVVVVLYQLFATEDGVLKVVTAPRHERDEHIAAKSEFAAIGAGAVREDLPLLDAIADANERLLVDARVLVRALELDERIDVRTDFAA